MAFTKPFTPQEITNPQQAARARAISAALIARPQAKNWAEGLAALTGAYTARNLDQAAGEAETAGNASVAEALAGLGPSSSMNDIAAALSNPWVNQAQASVPSALLQNQLQQADPYRQLQMRQAQLDYDQDLAGGQSAGETFFGNPVPIQTPNGIAYGQLGNQGSFNIPELPDGYSFLSPVQQLNTGTEFTGVDKFGNPVGVTAPINNLGAAQDSAVGKGLGEQQLGTIEAGRNAAANNSKLGILENLLATAPQGGQGRIVQLAGGLGIDIGGLGEVQAAQALINQLVPLQRAPGSGTMSDADLELYKASLPAILNQPESNQLIIATTKALNDYTIAHARIEEQLARNLITEQQALEAKAAIPNPLANFRGASGRAANPSAPYVDPMSGVTITRLPD